jgi:hypothetical protein
VETIMSTQILLTALTAANLGLLCYQSAQPGPSAGDVPAVLRARSLEIVDEHGRVRASLAVMPEDPKATWNGKPYPETVLFRLMSPEGRPNVKLGATSRGSGLLIGGEDDPTYVQVMAEGGVSSLKLINQDGVERLIKP